MSPPSNWTGFGRDTTMMAHPPGWPQSNGSTAGTGVRLALRHVQGSAQLCVHNCSGKRLRTEVNSVSMDRSNRRLCRSGAGCGDFRKLRSDVRNRIDHLGTSQITTSALGRKIFGLTANCRRTAFNDHPYSHSIGGPADVTNMPGHRCALNKHVNLPMNEQHRIGRART
jgi:hypothetical protein